MKDIKTEDKFSIGRTTVVIKQHSSDWLTIISIILGIHIIVTLKFFKPSFKTEDRLISC